jgi:hypothetical protein
VAVRQFADDTVQVQVPHFNKDPVWSLRPWPVTVHLGHRDWTIPALPAADWLTALMQDPLDPDDIFPGLLCREDQDSLEEALVLGDITVEEMYDAVLDIISTVSARSWWITLRLTFLARDSWDNLGAELILKGVDPERLSISAWLDAFLLVVLRNIDPKRAAAFTMQLEVPPEGESMPEEDMEMSADAFLSMA